MDTGCGYDDYIRFFFLADRSPLFERPGKELKKPRTAGEYQSHPQDDHPNQTRILSPWFSPGRQAAHDQEEDPKNQRTENQVFQYQGNRIWHK